MRDLLSIGTSRGCEMIGTGIGLGLSGFRVNPPGIIPTLDLNFASSLSLTSSSGITPSFSRASTGTYFNASGVLTSAAINAPRFDHVYNGSSWVSKGLLVEEQRTNLRKDSNALSSSFSTGPAQLSSAATVSPDATLNGWKFYEAPSSSGSVLQRLSDTSFVYSGLQSTFSIFAKAGERKRLGVFLNLNPGAYGSWFDLTTGSSGNDITYTGATQYMTNVGNGWYRCSMVVPSGGATTNYMQLHILQDNSTNLIVNRIGDGTSGLYLAFAQFEAGAFSTSYIPTTTAAVTRSADVCQITGTDFSGFWNEPSGSLVAEGDTPASGTRSLVSANNATANESSVLRTVGTDPLFVVTDGGVGQASIDAGTVSSGTAFKVAAAYTLNDFAASKDGAAVVTDTSGTIPTPTQITIGTDAAGNYLCGHIARLRYYNSRLTNSKLQELST